jgi:deferrochelatase/peroxidase EfeB
MSPVDALRRRSLLAAAGSAGVAGLAGCGGARPPRPAPAAPGAGARALSHQPGVVTPVPARAVLVAFDAMARDRAGLAEAFRALTEPARGATVTVAVGASLFDGRFGLHRPRLLTRMPAFPGDVLDPRWCHGDVLVQVGADDPGVLRAVAGRRVLHLRRRWSIEGFLPAGPGGGVRNLFGFREGAGNPDTSDGALMDRLVWVQPADDEPAWCAGGTYQVVRLIRLAVSTWDAEPATEQERVFGRRKDTGAPLGQTREDAEPDYAADPLGRTIALDAHIRRANPRTAESREHRIVRRGYSYRRPPDAAGNPDAGHIFNCFQRDPERGFATIQRRLHGEALQRYTLPFGGGYYFVLPGGPQVGRALLGSV